MKHFVLTIAVASLVFGATAPTAAQTSTRKLNVLFIVVDDLNNDLGCYGHAVVKSPNIDRLAARGVRFDRAYCQYALCAPSRCSFLSGLRPETTQVYDLKTVLRTRLPDVVFLPQLFRQHGYFTAGMGKVFHDMKQGDAAKSWDYYQDKMGDDVQEAAAVKKRYAYAQGQRPIEWTRLDGSGDRTRDGVTARGIARFMEEKARAGVPFFLAAGFHNPHMPWTAPAKYFALYPPERLRVAPEPSLQDVPAIALMTELTGNPAPRVRAEAIAAYYACISFMDEQVGLLLGALDRLNLWDNTIVVLLSDHGYHLGDHGGLWAKLTTFEYAARVPLVIAAPGHGRGKSSPRMVELVDLFPTLAELCALKGPAELEGKSLVPLLKQGDAPWDRPAYISVHHEGVVGKSVRTNRWRYTEWDNGKKGTELYDHDHDPGEYHNRASQPAQAGVVAELKQLLQRRMHTGGE